VNRFNPNRPERLRKEVFGWHQEQSWLIKEKKWVGEGIDGSSMAGKPNAAIRS
jgi:hypothetical protein